MVDKLPQGKIGHHFVARQSPGILSMLRDSGGVINTIIAIAAATGIVQKKDSK